MFFLLLNGWLHTLPAQQEGSASLPDVLTFQDGRPVQSAKAWPARRAELANLWQDTYTGRFPEKPPKLVNVSPGKVYSARFGTKSHITLTFAAPQQEIQFEIRLWKPTHDVRPQPLILTQPRHYQLAWAEAAVRRGYTVCLYPGVDYNHREASFPGYESVWRQAKDAYPEATWQSSLAIGAWLASRSLDYLLGKQEQVAKWQRVLIDSSQVGIIGHSRYAKQSLYAAAFDERIKAVVARSSGSPTAAGYRFTGRHTFMETVRDSPKEWAKASLKDYFGKENALPIEGNGLLAMIAPRACLLHTAYQDGSDPTFAVERTYRATKPAYKLLGAEDRLALQYRAGNHNPITEEHIQDNLDWFDWALGRRSNKPEAAQETLLHAFDWQTWKRTQSPKSLKPPAPTGSLADRLHWMLGDHPQGNLKLPQDDLPTSQVAESSRDRWKPKGVVRRPIQFGDDVHGNLMYSQKAAAVGTPLPVVIWLHPFNYSHGYNEGYGVEGTTIYYRLAEAGCAVLCYDQLGFGDRLLEGPLFDKIFPRWSRMGRMIHDVHCAVDFIANTELKGLNLDSRSVTVLGYSLGGMVGLHAAALDDRIVKIVSVAGFTPMRTDTTDKASGGIRRWSHWHALLPRLGLFHQSESRIPYDYHDLLEAIAPRKTLIIAPAIDWHTSYTDVRACIERSSHPALTSHYPNASNQFQSTEQQLVSAWLKNM